MKLIIQHNWTSGLGDMYAAATEYLNYAHQFKQEGFYTKLIFSLNGINTKNKYINNKIELSDIFDTTLFNKVFDEIYITEKPISYRSTEGCDYIYSAYMPNNPHPGGHWWDVFSDTSSLNSYNISIPNFNAYLTFKDSNKIKILPKFNSIVYEKEKVFLKEFITQAYSFIHIRYNDYSIKEINPTFMSYTNKIKQKIQNANQLFHIGSNNQYILDYLCELENTRKYKISNIDLFSNDHPYSMNNPNIDEPILINRLYDNLAEMVSVRNCNKIYYLSAYSWISNFLFYGLANNKLIDMRHVDEL